MTEAEWLACDDAPTMLDDLRGKASDRKFRLVACACARRVWGSLADERCRKGVEGLEGFADGRGGREDYDRAAVEIRSPDYCIFYPRTPEKPYRNFVGVGSVVSPHSSVGFYWSQSLLDEYVPAGRWGVITEVLVAQGFPTVDVGDPLYRVIPTAAVVDLDEEWRAHLVLVRDIFGNPCRPVAFDPVWRTAAAALAEAAYEERSLPEGALDPAPLAVLADALEDAGCTDAAILEHLRGPGPHVRGCWVVDLILGKQ
jgi:hypothetical protein